MTLHRVQDVVVGQAMADTGIEVIHAISRGRVNQTGAVLRRDVVGQIEGRQPTVAVTAAVIGVSQVVERMAEHQAPQCFAFDLRQHITGECIALQARRHQIGGQHQQAARGLHQGVVEFGMGIQGLVGRQSPSGGGPDDGECRLPGGQGSQAESLGQRLRVMGFEGHVQGVAALVGIFDLKFSQAGRAVKTPVDRLEAAIHKAPFDHAFERPNFAGFVAKVHGAIGSIPFAQNTQSPEIFALLLDLFRGESTALGLHVVAAELASMQFLDGVFNRQAVAIPARNVLGIETGQLPAFHDHVFQHFVQGMADVQLAIGVGRAIVEHEQRGVATGIAQAVINPLLLPRLNPSGFALGQVTSHGEIGFRQVQGVA